MKVDFAVSDTVVSMRVTISNDLRDAMQHYVQRAIAAEDREE